MGLIDFLFDTLLGPLHMSPYNRDGPVLRSSLATLFFVKISMCLHERSGFPSYRDLSSCNRDLGKREETFPYVCSSLVTGTTFLRQKQPFSQHSDQNGKHQVLYVFHIGSTRITFISKVTRVHKAMTFANDISLCFTILIDSYSVTKVCLLQQRKNTHFTKRNQIAQLK